jgi:hypothetical protein
MGANRALEVADAAGLTTWTKHRAQLALSVVSGRELSAKLPKDLHWSEEIALTFRLTSSGSAKR